MPKGDAVTTAPGQILDISDTSAQAAAIGLWEAGELVAIPTETVYGLAADATNDQAIKKLYAAKGRPSNNPLIAHVSGRSMAETLCDVPTVGKLLMDRFWPGPLTLVMQRHTSSKIAASVTAGLDTLAVRCPALDVTRKLIDIYGKPIAAPSANPSGRLSPTSAQAVKDLMADRVPLILDAGPAHVGIESTILGVAPDGSLTLLRPGSLSVPELEKCTNQAVTTRDQDTTKLTAPGQMASHYAPRLPVRLNAAFAEPGEVMVGFGAISGDMTLSATGNLDEAAQRLYATLAAADGTDRTGIAVAPIPRIGVGLAINDRLDRAAAPRPDNMFD